MNGKQVCTFFIVGLAFAVTGVSAQSRRDPSELRPARGTTIRPGPRYETLKARGYVSLLVRLREDSLAAYRGGVAGLAATNPRSTGTPLHVPSERRRAYLEYMARRFDAFEQACQRVIPEAHVVHRLGVVFGGVSLLVPEGRVEQVASLPDVLAVSRDRLLHLDTETSPAFVGADVFGSAFGGASEAGEGVIVGMLDTGVWPEHPSYADPDPLGNPYPAPPVAPGSMGFGSGGPRNACDFGDTAFNPNDEGFTCNNKLIGAYQFLDTYKAVIGLLPSEFDSARDDNGHGTHTSSTAAGNAGVEASIFGIPRGTVSGVAPRAQVIAYRVCADQGCFVSDSVRAVEQAILDGVDVINFSIGGGNDPYGGPLEGAFLDAYEAGVFVAASAGNSGPGADTVSHVEPWVTTVGASTTDRNFISTLTLMAGGDVLTLEGASLTDGILTPTDVVLASDFGDGLCLTPFASGTFSGQIVVCERGAIARVEKSFNVQEGGASGMVLYNPVPQGLATDNHFIPSVHLENDAGQSLLDFLGAHTGVTATFTRGEATAVQGDVMAAFSSRGGPGQSLGVSKPDVTAPGVQILAGQTPLPATVDGGLPGELFQAIQGTSMSSPHVAGAAALVKWAHPDFTPWEIKSTLMTTATIDGVTKEDGVTPADPFDLGSGRIDMANAIEPGLTFVSPTRDDFIDLQNELWEANYPSLYIPAHHGIVSVRRTVERAPSAGFHHFFRGRFWHLDVENAQDVDIHVPRFVWLPRRRPRSFEIRVDARNVPVGEVRHSTLVMKSYDLTARFPITIVRKDAPVMYTKTCDETDLHRGETTDCTISFTNTSFDEAGFRLEDRLPRQLRLVGDVSGATRFGRHAFVFDDVLGAAEPPLVDVAENPLASPFGYVPLAGFGGTLDAGATDESITNFNVPPFDYAGETYTQIGVVSNGYVVVGGGTADDVTFINSEFPDAALPNNVLAPFWTDLNPGAGGRVLVNVLSDGVDVWTVVEWESVPNFGDGETNTFQAWIGTTTGGDPGEDISFVYGLDISDGDGGFLTVGAENKFGNSGASLYFDGAGTPPAPSFPNPPGFEVDVFSVPGAPGETHTIEFTVKARRHGSWQNCSELTAASVFPGIATACVDGVVH